MKSAIGIPARKRADCGRNPVRAKNHTSADGHLGQFLNENCSRRAQFVYNVAVVHDLFAHVNRLAVEVQRNLDNVNRPHDAGAKSARPKK